MCFKILALYYVALTLVTIKYLPYNILVETFECTGLEQREVNKLY